MDHFVSVGKLSKRISTVIDAGSAVGEIEGTGVGTEVVVGAGDMTMIPASETRNLLVSMKPKSPSINTRVLRLVTSVPR